MRKRIRVTEKDVINFFGKEAFSWSNTVKIQDFIKKMHDEILRQEKDKLLTTTGIECELLKLGSQDWQKGRLKISLEFIPDEEDLDITESTSALDEFREE
jgi:KGK domain